MSIPLVKTFDVTYGVPSRLSPLVTRVVCNNPGPFTFTGSGTYLVGTDELAVIDPGPNDQDHLEALLRVAGDRPVSCILVTHTHHDHCGGAARLGAMTGAPVLAHGAHPSGPDEAPPALEEGADFSFRPDGTIVDGETVRGSDWTLRAVHTPGHIANHLCFALEEEHALFTGDHVMGWSTTVVAPPDGDMADYMNSLDVLIARDDEIYYPTHGPPVTAPRHFVAAVKTHRQRRDAAILASLAAGHETLMAIVRDVYRDTDPSLHIAAALNVQAHLAGHVEGGRVIMHGGTFPEISYSAKPDRE